MKTMPPMPTVVRRPTRRRRGTDRKPEPAADRPSSIDDEIRRRMREHNDRGSPHGRR